MSSDIIDEPVDIRLFDQKLYDKAVADAKKAESLLIKQGVIKRKLAAGIAPIQTETTPEPIEARRAEGQALPKSFRPTEAISGGTLASGVAPIRRQQKSFQDQVEENLLKKLGINEDELKKTTQKTQQVLDLQQDPIRFFANNLVDVFELATPVALATIALSLVQEGEQAFESLFEPGGPLDTRKLIHNASKVVPQLNSLVDMSDGTVFFTADAGQKLRQVAPSTSNTRNLVQEHMRYIVQFQGT